jgi:uncharacterized protein (DUF983 family)
MATRGPQGPLLRAVAWRMVLPGIAVADDDLKAPPMTLAEIPHPETLPDDADDRPLRPALLRGWRRRCPNCGVGSMMSGYLSVRNSCPVCGEALHHQRADDGPAYLTILIVGHIVAPVLLFVYSTWRPEPLVLALSFTFATLALSLFLLPRLKGAMVAFQWAKRMHGFGPGPDV